MAFKKPSKSKKILHKETNKLKERQNRLKD